MQIQRKRRSIPWMLRESRMRIIDGFAFYEFCQSCQKIAKHRIETDSSIGLGVCESCDHSQQLFELNEVFYDKTDLWVTRFKMNNMNNVVVGRLLHALRSWTIPSYSLVTFYYQLNLEMSNAHAFANPITSMKSEKRIWVLSVTFRGSVELRTEFRDHAEKKGEENFSCASKRYGATLKSKLYNLKENRKF